MKGEMPFKMHRIIFFSRKRNVCLPYLKFSDPLSETLLFFLLGLAKYMSPGGVTY